MSDRGEGPLDAVAFLCGEAYGYYEQLQHAPFRGKSGIELTRYLERAHLPREQCYVTNLCNFMPPQRNGKQLPPSKSDIERELPRLIDELNTVQPKWIGAIGRLAARTLTGQDLSLEWSHGWSFPLTDRIKAQVDGGFEGWANNASCIPIFHPASGLHNPEVGRFVWFDIKQFADYVNGNSVPVQPIDQYPNPQYIELRKDKAFKGFATLDDLALDTEGTTAAPFSFQLSSDPGSAIFIEAGHVSERNHFDCARLIGHNWLHDLHVCRAMNLNVDALDWDKVEDTMLMSFCLGTLPLGLKPLSRRISGAEQQSYSEVVAPYDRKMALEWISRAIKQRTCHGCNGSGKVPATGKKGQQLKKLIACPHGCIDGGLWRRRDEQLDYDWSSGKWKLKSGWQVQQYLRRLKKDIEQGKFDAPSADEDESDDGPRNVRQRVRNWPDDVQEAITDAVGEMPVATLRDVPRGDAVYYSCRDADLTLRNFPVLDRMIDEQGLRAAYRLDMDVIPVAAEMERNGMAVDIDRLQQLSRQLQRENDVILKQLQHAARRPINPASGDQVAALLFGERKLVYDDDDRRELQPHLSLELEAERMTRSGKRESTDDKVLEGLKLKYADRGDVQEVVQLILDYRTRHKLVTTYTDKIPRIAIQHGDHWRVHTRIRPTTAATYRWASGDPINLQNIPIRNKAGAGLGRLVRECFIAPPDQMLVSADYEQVELRVLAALSQDDELLRAFKTGVDPHLLGASRAWRMPYDDMLTKYRAGDRKIADIRDSAKNLNFGIVFGITPRGLMAQMQLRGLNYTLDQCSDLIRMWTTEVFPGIGRYIEQVQSRAKLDGYVRSVMGHMRHCPGVWSSIPSIREEALRQLVNFSIQCSAAEILKAGLRDLWRRGKQALDRMQCLMLMSVHDENLFQVPVENESAAIMIETYMSDPLLSAEMDRVRIGVKVKSGANWALLKG